MSESRLPRWVWAIWGAVGAGLEGYALSRKGGHTLSDTLRWLLGIKPARPWRTAGIVLIVAFCVWLALHITGVAL